MLKEASDLFDTLVFFKRARFDMRMSVFKTHVFAHLSWKAANGGGGGKTYRAILGGKRTIECALQTHFWRPQKVGLVWSAPVSSKENDRV